MSEIEVVRVPDERLTTAMQAIWEDGDLAVLRTNGFAYFINANEKPALLAALLEDAHGDGPRYPGESDECYWFRHGQDYNERCRPTARQLEEAGAVKVIQDYTGQWYPHMTPGEYWLLPAQQEGGA